MIILPNHPLSPVMQALDAINAGWLTAMGLKAIVGLAKRRVGVQESLDVAVRV